MSDDEPSPTGRTLVITCQCGRDKVRLPGLLLCSHCDAPTLALMQAQR